jgi:hypothetical protein
VGRRALVAESLGGEHFCCPSTSSVTRAY